MTKSFKKKFKILDEIPPMNELDWMDFYNEGYKNFMFTDLTPYQKKEYKKMLNKVSNFFKWKMI